MKGDLDAGQALKDKLTKATGDVDSTDLQLAGAFLSKAQSDIGKSTFQLVYEAARNFNCVALGPTTVFQSLDLLQSFAGVNSTTLTAAVDTYLIGKDIDSFQKSGIKFQETGEEVHLTLNKTDVPEWFRKVSAPDSHGKQNDVYRLTYTPDPDRTDLGFNKHWWDIRLESLQVYLHGAVQKKQSTTHDTSGQSVGMILSSNGLMSYRDRYGSGVHNFPLPEYVTSFAYDPTPTTAGKSSYKTLTNPMDPSYMRFKFADNSYAVPMQSPFTSWTVEPYDDVDITNCNEVEFVFKVSYRTTT